MLVACRLAGLSALEGTMRPVDVLTQSGARNDYFTARPHTASVADASARAVDRGTRRRALRGPLLPCDIPHSRGPRS
jgi:hypothetical protein